MKDIHERRWRIISEKLLIIATKNTYEANDKLSSDICYELPMCWAMFDAIKWNKDKNMYWDVGYDQK